MAAAGFRSQIFTFLEHLFGMFDSQVSEHGCGAALLMSGQVSAAEQTLDRSCVYGFKESPDDASFADGITSPLQVIKTQHSQLAVGLNHVRIIQPYSCKNKKGRVNVTARCCEMLSFN